MTGDCSKYENFASQLRGFDKEALREQEGVVFGLLPDLRLAFLNRAWSAFALQNGGGPTFESTWSLGRSVLDAISLPLQPFYVTDADRRSTALAATRRPFDYQNGFDRPLTASFPHADQDGYSGPMDCAFMMRLTPDSPPRELEWYGELSRQFAGPLPCQCFTSGQALQTKQSAGNSGHATKP